MFSLPLCLPPQDLEGIVDTFSDDEGDKAAQDSYINDENAEGDRRQLKEMVRRVREGFGEERGGGRGRGGNARGNLRLDELTRPDKRSRGEARQLGLLNRWVAACCCSWCLIRRTHAFRSCQRSSSCSSRCAVVVVVKCVLIVLGGLPLGLGLPFPVFWNVSVLGGLWGVPWYAVVR